jgi:hypothetical protein
MKPHIFLAVVLAVVTFDALAATITPASPTEQDVILATIDVPSSIIYDPPSTTVIGNVIRTNLLVHSFILGPPVFITHEFANFGPLPPGTYTYEVYQTNQGDSVLLSQQTIVVAPPIPTMTSLHLSILAIFLAAVGWFTLGKHQ